MPHLLLVLQACRDLSDQLFSDSRQRRLQMWRCGTRISCLPAALLVDATHLTFSAETRIEIAESVRGKDVFIMQTGGGYVTGHVRVM